MFTDARGSLRTVDARTKLAWLLATFVAGVTFTDIPSLLVILGTIALVAGVGGVLKPVALSLGKMWVLVIMIGLIFSLTVAGEPLFYLLPRGLPWVGGTLPVTREGLLLGIVSVLRMFVFVTPMAVTVMTTSNSDLLRALMFVRVPMEYALMIVLALNFVPLYLEEMSRIADAQRARAHSLMDQGPIGKMRAMVPIFVPLTLNAVDRADTIGKVLEIRGFSRRAFSIDFDPMSRGSRIFLAFCGGLLVLVVASMIAGTSLIAAALRGLQ